MPTVQALCGQVAQQASQNGITVTPKQAGAIIGSFLRSFGGSEQMASESSSLKNNVQQWASEAEATPDNLSAIQQQGQSAS